MDDLRRVQKCLQTLQDAPLAPVEPISYSEFLQGLQKLKSEVNDQLNRVKAFNYKLRQLKDSMRQEIPNILKLCHDNPLSEFCARGKFDGDAATNPGTPVMGTPRLTIGQKGIQKDAEVGIITPRRRIPFSMSKLLLQNKFAAACSPNILLKSRSQKTPVRETQTVPESTPQMPSRQPLLRKSVRKPVSIPAQVSSTHGEFGTTSKSVVPQKPSLTIPEATPEMRERVSFFMNPNAGNIHKRYVAIQDQDADESTCLLSTKVASKPSRTPELPVSCQKKPQNITLFGKNEKTPPLPVSVTKSIAEKWPPSIPMNSARKDGALNRTPSPPKSKPKHARICLENRIRDFQAKTIAPSQPSQQSRDHTEKLRWVDATPEFPRRLEARAVTVSLAEMNIPFNRAPPRVQSDCKTITAETPCMKGKPQSSDLSSCSKTNTVRNTILRDNVNSLRKKRLLAAIAETPTLLKAEKKKTTATPSLKKPLPRSSTMPANIENTTLPLRPSKMLRNKTVAL